MDRESQKRGQGGVESPNPRVGQRLPDRILIVHHKSKMTALVNRFSATLLKRQELIAQIDEGRSGALTPKVKSNNPR
jgi:hypothetical protein